MKSLILAVLFLRVDLVFCIQCYQCNETDRLEKCKYPKEVTCAGANEICFLAVTEQGKKNVHTCMEREEMFNCSSYDVCKRCEDNLCNAFPIMAKSQARATTARQCYQCFEGDKNELTLPQQGIVEGFPSCSSPSKDTCRVVGDASGTALTCMTATGKNALKRYHACGHYPKDECKMFDLDNCEPCATDLCNKPEGYVDPDAKNSSKPGGHDGASGEKGNKTEGHDSADDKKDNNKEKTIQCYSCFDGLAPGHEFEVLPSCSSPSKIKCNRTNNGVPFCRTATTTAERGKKRYHGCDLEDGCSSFYHHFRNCLSCETDLCNKPEENFGANAKNVDKKGNRTSSAVTLKNNAIPLLSLFLILFFSCCLARI